MKDKTLKKKFTISKYHVDSDILHITWEDGQRSQFSSSWLKSCVRNSTRFATDSLEYLDCPLNTELEQCYIKAVRVENNHLHIDWDDESEAFSGSWLRVQDEHLINQSSQSQYGNLWSDAFQMSTITQEQALASTEWISELDKNGILRIHGIDTNNAESAIRSIAAKIGVLHRRIHPTDINVLKPAPKNVGLDKAYTNEDLEFHTDAPYYPSPPKIAFLFCQRLEGTEFPINYFSDGYKICQELKKSYPEYYRLLTSTLVNFARRRPRSHHESAGVEQTDYAFDTQIFTPAITLDPQGNPTIIRFHFRSFTGFPSHYSSEHINEYAKAYRLFHHLLKQDKFSTNTVIEPGMMVVFNNHRLVHARSKISNTANRIGNLAYIDEYIWESRLRLLLSQQAQLPSHWLKGCTTQALEELANRWQ